MTDLTPGSPEWRKLITASKVAAILGVSPWQSPYALWREMRGDVTPEPGNDATRRGHYLEAGVLAWWRDQHPELDYVHEWREQETFTLGDWAAATPDLCAWSTGVGYDCLVEAKTAAYDDDWGDPGTDAIPDYYLVQTHWQMHVSGVHTCYVPVLTSRLRFAEYVVHYDARYGELLEERMREFYDSLSADEPPPLDDTVATFRSVKALHKDIDKGESVELDPAVGHELVMAAADLKEAEARDRVARSTVIEAMGTAQYATCDYRRVARRQHRGDAVTFVVTAKPSDLAPESEPAA